MSSLTLQSYQQAALDAYARAARIEGRAAAFADHAGHAYNADAFGINAPLALGLLPTLTASNAPRRLRDAGLFSQQGRGSATWYQPTVMLVGEERLPGESDGLSGKSEALSSNPDLLSSKVEDLSSKSDPVRAALLNELPGQLAARVGALGQRHPPERVRDLVAELCQLRAWRVDELALLIQRNPESIRQNYLRPLLAQQRIAMTLPETPHSPQQAYRSASAAAFPSAPPRP